MAVVSHNRAMGRGWDACSTQAGRARTPPRYDLAACRKIGRRHRHDRHPKRLTRPPRDTTLSVSRGERPRGELLGFSARAKGAGSAPRKGEWRVDRYHPESRKGRRKSSPLYAADDELIPVDHQN